MTETKMQLEDWLDDLCVRFIINLPREELESVERICFQVEEAQWFYEDFIRPLDPALPSLTLKAFALRIFQHCPLMSQWSPYHHQTAFSEFLAYKTRVPVRGAILLNQDMDEVVLVKGWKKGANWSFPRGKINKGEKDLDCAIREVYEETGFDVRGANLVKDDDAVKHIEISMREQHMRLYVFRGVPRDTYFEPRTRKEISKIEWYKLSELPTLKKNKQDEGMTVANANKFYMVAPFLHPLKKWISQQKKLEPRAQGVAAYSQNEGYTSVDENGFQTSDSMFASTAANGVPSDLPEVTSMQDVSSHLKRLLNINGGVPTPQIQPTQPAAVDQSKSNALLELLRQGSQDVVPQVQNAAAAPSTTSHPSALPMTHAPHLAPNFFPGFPQQQQHMAPTNFMQQTSAQSYFNGQPQSNMQHSHFPGHPEPSASPAAHHLPQMNSASHQTLHPAVQANVSVPRNQGTAPFQQTGDPQFSQQARPPQHSGVRVPPASNLPPPTLNSHSLALLDVFKNKSFQSPRAPPVATLAAPDQAYVKVRKTSQHQDSLLNLFKGQATSPAPPPVELSGNPLTPTPAAPAPAEVQILQRAPQQAGSNAQQRTGASKSSQTAATVSGPLNMPQFEANLRSAPKKGPNGPSRKNNLNRRDHQQAPQSAPIKILPRPQSSKRDTQISGPQGNQFAHQSPARPKAPEPVKPFQPQILRRSEKTDHENLMVNTPRTENVDRRSPAPPGIQTQTADLAQNSDRRPSQTNAQKEALLSLFGKPGLSPSSTSVQPDHQTVPLNQMSTAVSGLVSPISSRHFPSSGESISRHGTPSESDIIPNRIASPNHKAFLLGYLQGAVAKGSQ
ncbi:hypothetical protein N7520_011199 [Penicillium odoratum]|uniref:uncharacterized protein n=1 Tax=Penicillium odoratum TaxID=1167516 RepID=UPI0025472D54|nr:uncharacterized protein N7520_011199 [Penicillium odoratum]KAJ5746017.1 hypothetical protein N7520_011199 [Penicillium odoratum]